MNRWVRLHQNALHNPKIVSLSDRQYRAWTNLLLVAAAEDGMLPSTRDVACHLRMSAPDVELILSELVELDLIDMAVTNGVRTFKMHDWQEHQYISDTSTERVRKFRSKNKCNGDETFQKPLHGVTVTPPEADTESETDTEADNLALAPSARAEGSSFNNFGFGKASRCVSQRLRSKAEGLGLPVDELCRRATEPHVEVPNAMFRHLCVDHLQKIVPRAPRKMLAAALTRDGDAAFASVCQLILETT